MNYRQLNVRMDESTKRTAERIFSRLGMAPSDAVRLFYRQVALRRGLPFSVEIPNAETRAAFEELRHGGGRRMSLKEFKSLVKQTRKKAKE